ncbi:MAG: hypothetical protein KatS3mg081_0254 [Gemmatimonadales bacterium]|nr:hypothetical protein HRbin33_02158 [bacterium HR33]GIW50899.1 MAG: hypothetical protein KatS3mg081_0254 [Gemmatimonadales bacterium]
MSGDTVVVATFRTRLEAEIAAGLLQQAGIPYVIQSAEGIGTGPLPPGASLLVARERLEEARMVLESLDEPGG